jgi:hypothetical protein
MMTVAQHELLAGGRWQSLALVEQLAHVGSEVERALRAHTAARIDRRDRALTRALELFDLTAADHRWRGSRRREILRAREYVCRCFFDEMTEADTAEFLQRYFLQFANAARRAR